MSVRFDDLEDFDSAGTMGSTNGVKVPRGIDEVKVAIHIEDCPKCNGTGRWYGYSGFSRSCFKCSGTGKLKRKTSKAHREKAKANAHARKERSAEANLAAFEKANPEIAVWWANNDFAFALAMKTAAQNTVS